MIGVLCEASEMTTANAIIAHLSTTLAPLSPPAILQAGTPWAAASEWDDALIVVFRGRVPQSALQASIESYRNVHRVPDPATGNSIPGGFILPVALDPTATKPPAPIELIKSLTWDGSNDAAARLVQRLKVLLGLALMTGQAVFISYRAQSGAALARDLHERLSSAGFMPWLDEAKDNLAVGVNVQQMIHRQIECAALLVLVDTPDAVMSEWICEEVDAAYAQFVPILPVIPGGRNTSSFPAIKSNERRALVQRAQLGAEPLSQQDWEIVLQEIETLLLSCYQRRMRILSHAERAFVAEGFQWQVLDARRRMYYAHQQRLPPVHVVSHCLIHEPTDVGALQAYEKYMVLRQQAKPAQETSLCVYDRDTLLSKYELRHLYSQLNHFQYTLAHVSELQTLITTNFDTRYLK
jgi:hypothetical protein